MELFLGIVLLALSVVLFLAVWIVEKDNDDVYDNIINCIEWLIKEGYFIK